MSDVIAALDVSYPLGRGAVAAGVVFRTWSDSEPESEHLLRIAAVSPYIPGAFYRRELPCLLAVLEVINQPLAAIVIDGYVWLSEKQRLGLGARLYEALGGTTPIIGVAKSLFRGSLFAAQVQRGNSKLPLYITAAGIDTAQAALLIQSMHGKHRLPTLLKRVDQLSKSEVLAP